MPDSNHSRIESLDARDAGVEFSQLNVSVSRTAD